MFRHIPAPKGLLATLASLNAIEEDLPDIEPMNTKHRFLLDTNILSDLVRQPRGIVAGRI